MTSVKIRKRSISLIFLCTLGISFITAMLNSLLETAPIWFYPFLFATVIVFTYLFALLFNRFEGITRKKSHNYFFLLIEYFFKFLFLVVAFFVLHRLYYEVSVSKEYMDIFKEQCFDQDNTDACNALVTRLPTKKDFDLLLDVHVRLCLHRGSLYDCRDAAKVYIEHFNPPNLRTQEFIMMVEHSLLDSPKDINLLQYSAALYSFTENFEMAVKKQEQAILNYKLRAKALNKDLRFLPLLLEQLKRYETNQVVKKELLKEIFL